MTLRQQIESLKQDVQGLELALRNADARVTALSVVIGLMADHYPTDLAGKYIRECVEYGLMADLAKKETRGMEFLAQIVDPELFEELAVACEGGLQEFSQGGAFEMPGGRFETPEKKPEPEENLDSGATGQDPDAGSEVIVPMPGCAPESMAEADPEDVADDAEPEGDEKGMARDES